MIQPRFWGLLAVFLLASRLFHCRKRRPAPAATAPAASMPGSPSCTATLAPARQRRGHPREASFNAPASPRRPRHTGQTALVQALEADEECLIDDDELDANALPPQARSRPSTAPWSSAGGAGSLEPRDLEKPSTPWIRRYALVLSVDRHRPVLLQEKEDLRLYHCQTHP